MASADAVVTALVDFRSPDPARGVPARRLAFGRPLATLQAGRADEVGPLLDEVERHALAGRWCVGALRYEAAPAFDPALQVHAADGPLARFSVHEAPLADDHPAAVAAWQPRGATARIDWTGGPDRDDVAAAIARIHQAIAAGEYYQANLTAPLRGRATGDPFALFAALRRAQPMAYAALLAFEGDAPETVLSVSPELFFDWRERRLLARPMKGTAPRGATPAADEANARALAASEKERAENLMIVDLLRNDLSRVAEPFSVKVPRLFETEAWPTVWQMSSDIEARTREGTRLREVFAALFPCGSVTGAPKVRAMRALRQLEPGPRGVYCGAVGLVEPGGAATFNVPIRTVSWSGDGRATCGIGSGITADATPEGEWAEWRHKRAFVDRASRAFELLETLRLEDGAPVNGERHLARMAEAARHFGFAPVEAAARDALAGLAVAHPTGTWRVRLLADAWGGARAEAFAFTPMPAAAAAAARPRVALAASPLVPADSEFVRFKTTQRDHYDAFAPADPACFDTLLWNERGELTEFTRGNVALKLEGTWWTPPLAGGLLPGVGRALAIAEGRMHERVLRREDLARAEGLAFVNSLRGWIEVALAG